MKKELGNVQPHNARQGQIQAHSDDDTFDRDSFPYSELYGVNWNEDFNPLYRNISTKDVHQQGHHARGGGARQRAHFDLSSKKAKYAFCLVHDTVTRNDGTKARVRCHEVFLIDSGGCGKPGHQNNAQKDDGPNSIFQKLLRGETVSWKVLKDPEEKKVKFVKGPKQLAREMVKANEAALQAQHDKVGFINPHAMTEFFERRKKEDKIKAKTDMQRAKTGDQNMRGNKAFAPGLGKAIGGEDEGPLLSEAEARRAAAAAVQRAKLEAKAKNGGKALRPKSMAPMTLTAVDDGKEKKARRGFGLGKIGFGKRNEQ